MLYKKEKVMFCVGTTWENNLIDSLADINLEKNNSSIHEVFGALSNSFVGSGRESASVPSVSMEDVSKHVKYAHSRNISFNYLLNSSCMGGEELTKKGRSKLIEYLELINNLEVDIVTVATPYLLGLIKKRFPSLKVCISTISHIDTVNKARHWQDLGADRIVLSYMINRDFDLLSAITNALSIDVEIMANETCLYDCPMRMYHYNLVSHGSQKNTNEPVKYPFLVCTQIKLDNPKELIKARWIRPEDLQIYFNLGIKYIKLAGREKNKEWLVNCAKSYTHRTSPENFMEILAIVIPEVDSFSQHLELFMSSKKLKGFLKYFLDSGVNCKLDCGVSCNYCEEIASKVVLFNSKKSVKDFSKKLKKSAHKYY